MTCDELTYEAWKDAHPIQDKTDLELDMLACPMFYDLLTALF